MRQYKNAKIWNEKEVLNFFKERGSFSRCCLPHYRYDNVRMICTGLKKAGFIIETGRTETTVNYKASELFKDYFAESEPGERPLKWLNRKKRESTTPANQ